MSKLTTCKKCGTGNLRWFNNGERWKLVVDSGDPWINIEYHVCPVREIKLVSCEYCKADDLYWSKEIMEDNSTKNVLMDSFGLPHGCDEKRNAMDEKKQIYAKEKARLEAIPNKHMTKGAKNQALYELRKQLWPYIDKNRY